jgi:hypothetical protein
MTEIHKLFPNEFKLRRGVSNGDIKNGLCYMETVAFIAGEKITDRPQCACPIITAYGVNLNDRLPDSERQRLLPLVWATAGTRSKIHEKNRLEILCLGAVDMARLVLPGYYKSKHPFYERIHKTLEAAEAYWQKLAGAAAGDGGVVGHAACDTIIVGGSAGAAGANDDAVAAIAYAAYVYNVATATADMKLRSKIIDMAIDDLRRAIEAGPNGGIPTDQAINRIKSHKHLLAACH